MARERRWTRAEPGANTVAKDGSTMPLATEEGGGNKDVAISEQDSGARDISPRILSAC
ncbi:MAG TPA: hypothetical protein VIZ90_19150 [Rhizobiaceae bacterium]